MHFVFVICVDVKMYIAVCRWSVYIIYCMQAWSVCRSCVSDSTLLLMVLSL
jgi:hypothetical protein